MRHIDTVRDSDTILACGLTDDVAVGGIMAALVSANIDGLADDSLFAATPMTAAKYDLFLTEPIPTSLD